MYMINETLIINTTPRSPACQKRPSDNKFVLAAVC